MDADYWNTLKGELSNSKNGKEPVSKKEQRRLSPHNKRTSCQIYNPTHPMRLRSGIRKHRKVSPSLTGACRDAEHQGLVDFCQVMVDEAPDETSSIISGSPQAEVRHTPDTDSSELGSSQFEGIPALMGEIYKDLHAASTQGLNTVIRRLTITQVLEPKPRGSAHWIRSSLWLDLAARNQVIGWSNDSIIRPNFLS